MRYTVTAQKGDGSTYQSSVDTTAGDTQAVELAKNLAESYGHTLVGLTDADGKELNVGTDEKLTRGDDDQHKDTEERVEEQDQTTTERVDTQKVSTKEAKPNKTGDVRSDH